jgi:hypothetical protein
MTFDETIVAFSDPLTEPLAVLEQMLEDWDAMAPGCRALLTAYADGSDTSEQTERALFYVVHALGEKGDTASFPAICRLLEDAEQSDLLFGDTVATTLPCILISTYNGDPAPLQRLVELETPEDVVRGESLIVLAYLTRTKHLTDAWMTAYLTGLLDQLQPQAEHFVWFAWVRAVAALGYAGQAAQAEALFTKGFIDPDLMLPKEFWEDLRETQADPAAMSATSWNAIGPLEDAVGELQAFEEGYDDQPEPQQPITNPLRSIGRNDPCPCGSGKKYKKCCLAA